MPSSILPPNATQLEQDLEALFAQYLDTLPLLNLNTRLDPAHAPVETLAWVAQALGVESFSSDWPIERQRAAIEAAYRAKWLQGTPFAVKQALAFIGLPFSYEDQTTPSGTFDLNFELGEDYQQNALVGDPATLRLLDTAKRYSQHANIKARSQGASQLAIAAIGISRARSSASATVAQGASRAKLSTVAIAVGLSTSASRESTKVSTNGA